MTSRTLSKRLERLETRIIPAGESLVGQIQYVSPDGASNMATGLACLALEGVASGRSRGKRRLAVRSYR
jgi:hypothetical protein